MQMSEYGRKPIIDLINAQNNDSNLIFQICKIAEIINLQVEPLAVYKQI